MEKKDNFLDNQQLTTWKETGFLLIKNFYTESEKKRILELTGEMASWDEIPGKWMKYYENNGNKQLARMEFFLDFEKELNDLVNGKRIFGCLQQLLGEEALLYKEKINFKLPGGGSFEPHQDAPAFATFGQKYHITICVPVDPATLENGCLEMSPGNHLRGILPQESNGTLSRKVEAELSWIPIYLELGDIVFFDSLIPHRSGVNNSKNSRRAYFITYNGKSEGDRRQDYFSEKRAAFPPDYERIPGKIYPENHYFNLGNPIKN
jgi:2-aminoethylphosphonate dioxygenase